MNVIGSLAAPELSWETEAETLRDEIEGTVTSLLGLVGVEADPLSSREFVLLSNLIENAWRAGQWLGGADEQERDSSTRLQRDDIFVSSNFYPSAGQVLSREKRRGTWKITHRGGA